MMNGAWCRALAVGLALAIPTVAAEEEGAGGGVEGSSEQEESTWQLALRVTAVVGGSSAERVVIDRGTRDGLRDGDVVTFLLQGGTSRRGVVRQASERRATVDVDPGAPTLEVGARGVARVARARRRTSARRTPREPEAKEPAPKVEEETNDRPPIAWEEDEWVEGLPLLARTPAVRPAERPARLVGRSWVAFDGIWGSGGGRSDKYWRVGTDLSLENPFGHGGELLVDLEANGRRTQLPADLDGDPTGDDASSENLRIDRLGYTVGGTRFAPERWTFGRFLSRDVPEFGVHDGAEWSRRLESGHRVGASAGFLPEPDAGLDGSSDFGVGGWYEWVRDAREETTFLTAVQSTLHDGELDRNQLILRARHTPSSGWTGRANARFDLHAGDDVDSGLALTELRLDGGRRWGRAYDLRVVYDHQEIPDLEREDFPLFGVDRVSNGRRDRIGADGSMALSARERMRVRLGVWDDEADSGGDAQLALDLDGTILERLRTEIAVFAVQGRFSEARGARLSVGRLGDRFGWDLAYEIVKDTLEGFDAIGDDAVQHRVRASGDWYSSRGWNLSIYGEALKKDLENTFALGFHFGRSF